MKLSDIVKIINKNQSIVIFKNKIFKFVGTKNQSEIKEFLDNTVGDIASEGNQMVINIL